MSIGYSACHWCHVMAHESFEDPEVAAAMNADFVNIKVDREERPDLDQIYQAAHALLTRRSGGWPLTMFLTPEGAPFFGGTYFPKQGRYGLPGFLELLPRVAAAYREQGPAIAAQSAEISKALASLEPRLRRHPTHCPASAPGVALAGLLRQFDPVHGGFGGAPKFPHETELDFCLREHAMTGNADALVVARVTLERMADGGIHDQLGGGFCRYSVDAEWTIPHFEKMLYDNGPLVALYADLARVTGEARPAEVARGIVAWLTREMRAPDGAFYSSLDADSEGEEGKFYVWTRDEVKAALSPEDYAVAALHYGLDGAPNFEGHAWNLRVAVPLAEVAARLDISAAVAAERLAAAKAALLAARSRRVRPGLDDKILTSWNALAIGGLARAARALDVPEWIDLAASAADALRRTSWRDGRLLATRKGEHAHLNAYLDDHAFLLAALIELMQARFRVDDYAWARALADVLLARFEDTERGGFFFTSHDHERLFHRTKPGSRQRDPVGKRRRRRVADRARPPGGRAALRRCGRARGAALRAGARAVAGGLFVAARRARGRAEAADHGASRGRRRDLQRVAAEPRIEAPAHGSRVQCRGHRACPPSSRRGPAARRRRRVGLPRDAMSATHGDAAGNRARARALTLGQRVNARGGAPLMADRRPFRYHGRRFSPLSFQRSRDENCRNRTGRRRITRIRRRARPVR